MPTRGRVGQLAISLPHAFSPMNHSTAACRRPKAKHSGPWRRLSNSLSVDGSEDHRCGSPRPEPEERRSTLAEERALAPCGGGTLAGCLSPRPSGSSRQPVVVGARWSHASGNGVVPWDWQATQEGSGVRKVRRDSPRPFHRWSAMTLPVADRPCSQGWAAGGKPGPTIRQRTRVNSPDQVALRGMLVVGDLAQQIVRDRGRQPRPPSQSGCRRRAQRVRVVPRSEDAASTVPSPSPRRGLIVQPARSPATGLVAVSR